MENNKNSIHIKVGGTYSIEMKGSGTTGYQWKSFPEKNKLIAISKSYASKGLKKELIGASANEVFTITALQKGKTIIQLKQIKAWEKNPIAANEATYEIVVE